MTVHWHLGEEQRRYISINEIESESFGAGQSCSALFETNYKKVKKFFSEERKCDKMTEHSIYGAYLKDMEQCIEEMEKHINALREELKRQRGMDPVEHFLSRIKSEESILEKCDRKGLPHTTDSVLFQIHDAIGIRIICAFVSDVYLIRDDLARLPEYEIVEEKDYIRHAKPNGYRSYHMILKTRQGFFMEVQLRTISMDTWAALEHHLKYKRKLCNNEQLIVSELKRCADELASTDISMQTIRDMIFEGSYSESDVNSMDV